MKAALQNYGIMIAAGTTVGALIEGGYVWHNEIIAYPGGFQHELCYNMAEKTLRASFNGAIHGFCAGAFFPVTFVSTGIRTYRVYQEAENEKKD